MGGLTQVALHTEKWDYVGLQEMSNGPISTKKSFLKKVGLLCKMIRENGAVPVLYATWAYQRSGKQLEVFGMDYNEMYQQMYASYHEAEEKNKALIADVGKKFYELADKQELYAEDGCHPNKAGSQIAAETLAEVILANAKTEKKKEPAILIEQESTADENDKRLRLLYLYQLLLTKADELHNIHMHRTTVMPDIELLRFTSLENIKLENNFIK